MPRTVTYKIAKKREDQRPPKLVLRSGGRWPYVVAGLVVGLGTGVYPLEVAYRSWQSAAGTESTVVAVAMTLVAMGIFLVAVLIATHEHGAELNRDAGTLRVWRGACVGREEQAFELSSFSRVSVVDGGDDQDGRSVLLEGDGPSVAIREHAEAQWARKVGRTVAIFLGLPLFVEGERIPVGSRTSDTHLVIRAQENRGIVTASGWSSFQSGNFPLLLCALLLPILYGASETRYFGNTLILLGLVLLYKSFLVDDRDFWQRYEGESGEWRPFILLALSVIAVVIGLVVSLGFLAL